MASQYRTARKKIVDALVKQIQLIGSMKGKITLTVRQNQDI